MVKRTRTLLTAVALGVAAGAAAASVLVSGPTHAATTAPRPDVELPRPAGLAGLVEGLLARQGPVTGPAPDLLAGRSAPTRHRWAPVATAALHPGVQAETPGAGICTTNFVFTAGPRTFLGQAAHCAGTGEATETDGCRSATLPVGSPVLLRGSDDVERTATLAYSSWASMQARGETDPDRCAYNDFALIELAAADVAALNPSVPFFGGPAGLDRDRLVPGQQVFTYGNSPLRLGVAQLRPKVGVVASTVAARAGRPGPTGAEAMAAEVYTVTPGVPGDSGSAFLDERGAAVGLLSTLNLAPLPISNGVSGLAAAVDYATAHGGAELAGLAMVAGTEPFTAQPAGVPPTELAPPAGPPPARGQR